jgi:hypothetical protein
MKLKGVWTRRPDMEFADKQGVNAAYALISRHPYTISTIDEFSKEYAAIFGEYELAVLRASCTGGKFNMVASCNQAWVLGGIWVAPDPKPEPVLLPGNEWKQTPFGKVQGPIVTSASSPNSTVTALSPVVKAELSAMIFAAVTDALETWAVKT